MANPQTTETTTQLLLGAVKVEVSSSSNMAGAVDLGACNGVKYTEEIKIATLENDNAVDRDIISEMKGLVEFDQLQVLNEAARVIMRGSIETITNTAGSLVTGATQVIAATWTEKLFYPFSYKNSSGAVPTITGVVQSPATSLTVNTDYFVIQDDNGNWGIYFVDNATTNPALSITVTMNYTPAASVSYEVGGKSTIPYFYIRLTSTDENGKIFKLTSLGKCNLISGDEYMFQKYNADDPRVKIPIKIQIRQDSTLTAGKQLMKKEVVG